MKNSTFKVLCIMIPLFLVSLGDISAQRQGVARTGDAGPRMERENAQRLRIPDLTDEQEEKIKEMRFKMQKESLPLKNELREKEARMRTLSTAETPNMKAINQLIEEMGELKIKLHKLRAANHQEIRKILTEEQRLAFDSRSPRKSVRVMRQHQRKMRSNTVDGE